MRKFNEKVSYILIPVIVLENQEIDEFAESSEFKQVIKIVSALSAQDTRIADFFREKNKKKRSKNKIIEIDENINSHESIDVEVLVEKLESKVWERVGQINWRPYEEAKKFAQSLGGILSSGQWKNYIKKHGIPADIPRKPDSAYTNGGWIS